MFWQAHMLYQLVTQNYHWQVSNYLLLFQLKDVKWSETHHQKQNDIVVICVLFLQSIPMQHCLYEPVNVLQRFQNTHVDPIWVDLYFHFVPLDLVHKLDNQMYVHLCCSTFINSEWINLFKASSKSSLTSFFVHARALSELLE